MAENIFGNNLKLLRKKRGLTQLQLANKLNISPSSVGMYEQGRREPDNSTLFRICSELRISMDYLLGISNEDSIPGKEVNVVIDEFTEFLSSQKGLMFNGNPITSKDREKIVNAIKIAAAVATYKSKS